MKTIKIQSFLEKIDQYKSLAKKWNIFIYPTDTIYWIWGEVIPETTEKIYEIKKRERNKPFSIIAPNTKRIKENFKTNNNFEEELNKFLNKFEGITLLLEKKDPHFLNFISNSNKLWIRMLKHPFQKFINYLWNPFITSSANISWQETIKTVSELNKEIIQKIDIIIDWWKLWNKASTIIDYNKNITINRRTLI